MFLACGVAAYSTAIFHLVTHAFFKALLFLAAGSVIHALGGEQDMRLMGGLRTKIPVTFWTMTAAVFAICGFFPFAGFFSKDAILFAVYNSAILNSLYLGKLLWAVGLLTAGLTSFYMFRLWYLAFFGTSRFNEEQAGHGDHHGVHEGSWTMLLPLMILGVLSLVGGWIGWPEALGGHDKFAHFLDPVFGVASAVPAAMSSTSAKMEQMLAGLSMLVALLGWLLAHVLYLRKPQLPARIAKSPSALYALLLHKYWIDELYAAVIVRPLLVLSRVVLWRGVDAGLVDGSGLALATTSSGFSSVVRRLQSGNIRSYAGWLAMGAAQF